MPCTQTGSLDGDRRLIAGQTAERINAENTRLTQLLCGLCNQVEEYDDSWHIRRVPGLGEWWENHKEIDRRRADQ